MFNQTEITYVYIPNLAAIDPLAIHLPTEVYMRWIERLHPHVPKVSEIQEVVRSMTPEEKASTLARARTFMAYSKIIEEAVTTLG